MSKIADFSERVSTLLVTVAELGRQGRFGEDKKCELTRELTRLFAENTVSDKYPVHLKYDSAKSLYEFIKVLGERMYQAGGGNTVAYEAIIGWEMSLLAALIMAKTK
jgi:hypothetical protein